MLDPVKTFREATDQQCNSILKLLDLDTDKVAAFSESIEKFLSPPGDNKFVYGLAAGRSALSLYSFLQLIQNHFENVFPFTLEDPVQRHYRTGRNLSIAVSGSGETKVINKYIEDIIQRGGDIKLITANEEGTAYKMVSKYKRGLVLLIKAKTKRDPDKKKQDKNHDIMSELLPLGTEFELVVLAFLNALFVDIQNRLKDFRDPSCLEYSSAIRDFEQNARLISKMDSPSLDDWLRNLLDRKGRYIIGGVGRSGLVARAFEMRLTHLGKASYWENDFNTPSFRNEDVYIPITGSGNTYEVLESTETALKKDADVMPILACSSSLQTSIRDKNCKLVDAAIIPVKPNYESLYMGNPNATTTCLMSDYSKFRHPVFEINASIFTNSVVAAAMKFLNIDEEFMEKMHK